MALEDERPDPLTGDPAPHKEADDAERIYYEGSPMLRFEIAHNWLWVLLGLAVIAIPIVWRFVLAKPDSQPFAWWWFLVAIVLGVILILVPWIRTKMICYKISNYRIDVERGIIARNIDTMELWHVDDVKLSQGVLDRLLGVGTISIFSSDDTNPELKMEGLPSPRPLFDALKQRIIAVKRQRGVVKMDMG